MRTSNATRQGAPVQFARLPNDNPIKATSLSLVKRDVGAQSQSISKVVNHGGKL
jgi:hypothetical protein